MYYTLSSLELILYSDSQSQRYLRRKRALCMIALVVGVLFVAYNLGINKFLVSEIGIERNKPRRVQKTAVEFVNAMKL